MDTNNSRRRTSKHLLQQKQVPTTVATMQKSNTSKPTPNDSNHLPAHLIAPEARNFAHHKRVGDYATDIF